MSQINLGKIAWFNSNHLVTPFSFLSNKIGQNLENAQLAQPKSSDPRANMLRLGMFIYTRLWL